VDLILDQPRAFCFEDFSFDEAKRKGRIGSESFHLSGEVIALGPI
jgi:hypothetical protein